MPNFDRTGPEGKGPRTGRNLGDCNDSNNSNNNRRGLFGRGNGFGRGAGNRQGNQSNNGRGRGWRFFGRRNNND